MCEKAGCTALGFLLALTHKAEDATTPETARDIITQLSPLTESVMVTHSLDPQEIAGIATFTGVSTIQIHDDLAKDGIIFLKQALPQVRLMKAVHIEHDKQAALAKATAASTLVDGIILDSRTKDRLGGTGQTHDWGISASIVQTVNIPVVLAGGLTPENVVQAVQTVRPYGVDVNSGVEQEDSAKSDALVAAFSVRARQALVKITA